MSRISFLIVLLLLAHNGFTQAPSIKYVTPQTLIVGEAITPLVPKNSGGIVPANNYKQVSTLAGNGNSTSIDGIGMNASFNMPSGIATDAANNTYVCDYGSGAIRKITTNGTCTTIANVNSPAGLTIDDLGNIFISSATDNAIYKINNAGVKSLFATGFNNPSGLCFDLSGNLIVADQGNNKIKKVNRSGHVSTLAGTGLPTAIDGTSMLASFNNPTGVAIDKAGNIYVADSKNNKIRKISSLGMVSTFAGDGSSGFVDRTGTNAKFFYPTGLVVDQQNNVYVTDTKNNSIRKIAPSGDVSTLAGNGSAGSSNGNTSNATFNNPSMLTNDADGNLLLTDFAGNSIRKIALTGYSIDKPLPNGLSFDTATGIITGTATDKFFTLDFIVTAYNAAGNNSTLISIESIIPSKITYLPLPKKSVCDADFDPGAVSGLTLHYISSNLQVAEIIGGKVHIVGPGVSTIVADNGLETESQVLTVSGFNKPYAVITADTYSTCQGITVTFSSVATDEGSNPSYKWTVNGNDVGVNNSTFSTNTLKNGDAVSFIITNNDYCVPVSSEVSKPIKVTVTPYANISVAIAASEKGPICVGFPITFTAIPYSNLADPNYKWFINNQDTGQTGYTFTSARLQEGDVITCQMESMGMCVQNPVVFSNALTISIKTDCETIVPNSFSPNGDGVNDLWKISSLNPDATIKVFNRNGSIIFQSAGHTKDWDGTDNGKELPSGTYYYLIISDRGSKKISGNVTLFR